MERVVRLHNIQKNELINLFSSNCVRREKNKFCMFLTTKSIDEIEIYCQCNKLTFDPSLFDREEKMIRISSDQFVRFYSVSDGRSIEEIVTGREEFMSFLVSKRPLVRN